MLPQDDGESNEGNLVIDTNTHEMTRVNAKHQRTRDVRTVIFFFRVRNILRATQCCVGETFKSLSFIFESLITPTSIYMYSLYLSLYLLKTQKERGFVNTEGLL